jgi:hypothetical protein
MTPGEYDLRTILKAGGWGSSKKTENGVFRQNSATGTLCCAGQGFTCQTVIKAATEADTAIQAVSVVKGGWVRRIIKEWRGEWASVGRSI